MRQNPEQKPDKPSSKRAARLGKKVEKSVLSLVVWTLALTFPVWIYGMALAIGKGELRSIAAMVVLIAVSGFCCWFKIASPIVRRFQSTKIQTSEN